MYPPFELNNLCGPFMVVGAIAAALLVTIGLNVYKDYLHKEDAKFRK